jgi:hypothetical protein
MTKLASPKIAEEAARAARQAAREATTPEARFFLRQHADLLARIAAAERRARDRFAGPAALVLPLAGPLLGWA